MGPGPRCCQKGALDWRGAGLRGKERFIKKLEKGMLRTLKNSVQMQMSVSIGLSSPPGSGCSMNKFQAWETDAASGDKIFPLAKGS